MRTERRNSTEPAVRLTRAHDLSGMPRQRGAVECHEYEAGLPTGNQKGRVIQAQPQTRPASRAM